MLQVFGDSLSHTHLKGVWLRPPRASKSQSLLRSLTTPQSSSAALPRVQPGVGDLGSEQNSMQGQGHSRPEQGSKLCMHKPRVYQPSRKHPVLVSDTTFLCGPWDHPVSAKFQNHSNQNMQFCYPPWAWCSSQQQ